MPDAPLPLFVVLNPGSGDNEARQTRDEIAGILAASGRPHEIIEAAAGGIAAACRAAARRARESGGALVAVGGDGTLNTAAQSALTEGCPLGVIAQGTFNLFAREHGLPLEAGEATRCLLAAQPQPVDVGLVNQRVFLVNASIGLYPRVLRDREALNRKLGRHRWVALLSGVVSLLGWHRRLVLEIEQDGLLRQLRTPTLFVGNNRQQLERFGIPLDAEYRVGRGGLAGLAPRPQGSWAKLRLLMFGLVGRLGDTDEMESFVFRTLAVKTGKRRSLPVATDGEVMRMRPPLLFSVSSKPLMLLKPAPAEAASP
jgi:diacylglycerol kinase family enzyme